MVWVGVTSNVTATFAKENQKNRGEIYNLQKEAQYVEPARHTDPRNPIPATAHAIIAVSVAVVVCVDAVWVYLEFVFDPPLIFILDYPTRVVYPGPGAAEEEEEAGTTPTRSGTLNTTNLL